MFGAILALVVFSSQAPDKETMVRMQAWSRALGVACVHCHVPDQFETSDKPAFEMARRMSAMIQDLSRGPLESFGGVTCWTCHRGRPAPPRHPREDWEAVARQAAGVFEGRPESLRITMSVYTSALGVGCDHCHDPAAWPALDKPAMQTAQVMVGMFDRIRSHFTKARMPVLQCYMCHQGATRPPR